MLELLIGGAPSHPGSLAGLDKGAVIGDVVYVVVRLVKKEGGYGHCSRQAGPFRLRSDGRRLRRYGKPMAWVTLFQQAAQPLMLVLQSDPHRTLRDAQVSRDRIF